MRMLTAYRHFKACVELCARHGFGRIEVANRPMAAITRIYTCDLAGAMAEGLDAVAAADRVGHHRAAIIARHSVYFCAMARGELALAREHAERALEGRDGSAQSASNPSPGVPGRHPLAGWRSGRRHSAPQAGAGDQPRERHRLNGTDAARNARADL
jgi:hypothetical protein